jgi:hypothetical protein
MKKGNIKMLIRNLREIDEKKQCDIHVVVKSFVCDCDKPDITWYGNDSDKKYFCFSCKKEAN